MVTDTIFVSYWFVFRLSALPQTLATNKSKGKTATTPPRIEEEEEEERARIIGGVVVGLCSEKRRIGYYIIFF